MVGVFSEMLNDETYVDVTLACDGQQIKAHKMVLSACSSYFRELLQSNPCQHPIIIFNNMRLEDLRAVVYFMYCGEVNVSQHQLASLLRTAEVLRVKGLTEVNDKNDPPPPPSPVIPQPRHHRDSPILNSMNSLKAINSLTSNALAPMLNVMNGLATAGSPYLNSNSSRRKRHKRPTGSNTPGTNGPLSMMDSRMDSGSEGSSADEEEVKRSKDSIYSSHNQSSLSPTELTTKSSLMPNRKSSAPSPSQAQVGQQGQHHQMGTTSSSTTKSDSTADNSNSLASNESNSVSFPFPLERGV